MHPQCAHVHERNRQEVAKLRKTTSKNTAAHKKYHNVAAFIVLVLFLPCFGVQESQKLSMNSSFGHLVHQKTKPKYLCVPFNYINFHLKTNL